MLRLPLVAATSLATFALPLHAQETKQANTQTPVEFVSDTDATHEIPTGSGTEAPALPVIRISASRYHFKESDTALESHAATRTDTPLIEVAQSVQVIPRNLIQEQDARTLADALVNVSGVVPTKPEEALLIAPIIRGFPAETYLDGLPIFGGNQQAFNPASLVGVERIEVLKGPSSSLYGGGLGSPLGGLVNIESERPDTEDSSGYIATRTGSFSTVNPYGDYNLSLGDKVAVRLAGEYQHNDSWIDKVHGERLFFQPSILFKIDPQTELLISGQYNQTRQLEYSGLPAQQALAVDLHGILTHPRQ